MSQQIKGSHWKGPLLGDSDSMGGALEDFPLGVFADTKYTRYFNDFQNADTDYVTGTNGWTLTQVSGGGSASIIELADTSEGILRLDCPVDNDGPILQYDMGVTAGLSPIGVTPTAATAGSAVETDALFVCRFRILDVSGQGIFVGLAELNATSAIKATPEGAITSDTHIGFAQSDSDVGAIYFTVAGDDDTAAVTDTSVIGTALTDSEYIEVAVRARGTDKYSAFVKLGGAGRTTGADWSKVASGTLASGNTWDAQMLISLCNIGGGTTDDLDVDYVTLLQKRDLIE